MFYSAHVFTMLKAWVWAPKSHILKGIWSYEELVQDTYVMKQYIVLLKGTSKQTSADRTDINDAESRHQQIGKEASYEKKEEIG